MVWNTSATCLNALIKPYLGQEEAQQLARFSTYVKLGARNAPSYMLYSADMLAENIPLIEQQINITHEFLLDGKDKFSFSKREDYPLDILTYIQNQEEYLTLYPLKNFLDYFHTVEDYL